MPRLNRNLIVSAPRRAKAYFLWDEAVVGLGVLIHPKSAPVFYVDYRTLEGRRRMKLGAFGAVTVDEARKLAQLQLGQVAHGKDPLIERKTRRAAMTVSELCAKYLAAVEAGEPLGKRRRPKKPSTIESDRSRIRTHVIPLLGRKRVQGLTTAALNQFLRDVTGGKTAAPKGRKSTGGAGAARTLNLLSGILSFAVQEGIADRNPAMGVRRAADGRRTRRLVEEEYRRLGSALRDAGRDPGAWRAVSGIRLLALTGLRLGELVELRWSEIDGSVLRLGDSKEGASIRPIGAAAIEILATLPSRGGEYVLPGERATTYGALPRAIDRIMKAAGIEGVSAHTLRHSFASVAADLEFAESTIGACLGHAGRSTTSRYIHRVDKGLIAAADVISTTIADWMNQ